MRKITTLFKKDPNDLGRVINEVDPENEWALTEGVATQKFDGTACAVIDGEIYKRFDAKHGKPAPVGGVPCQDPDPTTGHWPFWVKCEPNNPADKYAFEGFRNLLAQEWTGQSLNLDGTYELCGPKVQRNAEGLDQHRLLKHGFGDFSDLFEKTFEGIKEILSKPGIDIEGFVFHHPDGRMCKIRKKDFGIKRVTPILDLVAT